jgi:hypothetical protein
MMCQTPPVHAGRPHPQQHRVVTRLGPVDLLEPQDVGLAVDVLHDRLHRRSGRTGSAAAWQGRCSVPITSPPWCSPSPDCAAGAVGPHWCACRVQTRSSAAAPRRACISCCPRSLQAFRSSATGRASGRPPGSGGPRSPRTSSTSSTKPSPTSWSTPTRTSTEPIRAHPERVARRMRRPDQTVEIAAVLLRDARSRQVQDLDHGRGRAHRAIRATAATA